MATPEDYETQVNNETQMPIDSLSERDWFKPLTPGAGEALKAATEDRLAAWKEQQQNSPQEEVIVVSEPLPRPTKRQKIALRIGGLMRGIGEQSARHNQFL